MELKKTAQMNIFTKQSHRQKTNLCLPKRVAGCGGIRRAFGMSVHRLLYTKEGSGVRWDTPGVRDEHTQTTIHKTDKQQALTVQHKELYSVPCSNVSWKRL